MDFGQSGGRAGDLANLIERPAHDTQFAKIHVIPIWSLKVA